MSRAALVVVALGVGMGPAAPVVLPAQQPPSSSRGFDHPRHERLFPTCVACHRGAVDPELALWPAPTACAACHDGTNRPAVRWEPPPERPSNLKFAHELLPIMNRQTPQGPEPLACRDCHVAPGGSRMAVRRASADGCLACHGAGAEHLAAPDQLCETCHVPLVRAVGLRRADVAGFPVPPSHRQPGFLGRAGHGALATGTAQRVAASCTICHARDFCLTCHVDAPERPAIQALAADARSTAIVVRLAAPAGHRDRTFLARHGAAVRENAQQCSTCHTRESCLACHAPSQRVGAALPARAPDRGAGAQPVRRPPDTHGASFVARHAPLAATTATTCAGCHVQTDCMACHRPAAAAGPGYHPSGFLVRHPAAAYARESSCAECHNVGNFCQTCHQTAGLVSPGPLRSGYHDANRFFVVSHGLAARQSLESCVSCHVERDCLACHSAVGGRRFNPHGPDFDASRLRRKNPEMCSACHGTRIPGG
jgi:hypothetical protein